MVLIHDRHLGEISAQVFHDIVRLRVDVFIVEQSCPYPELDGGDAADTTRHVYVTDDLGVVTYLRILRAFDADRIGRVVTRAADRSRGLSGALLDYVLTRGDGPWVLDAQAHLVGWYARRGFVTAGEDYLDYGILHTPMRRDTNTTTSSSSTG